MVEWKHGSSNWIALKDLKESYPVELALYGTNRKINDKPAFTWWVPFVVKKKSWILQKVKSKYWAPEHDILSDSYWPKPQPAEFSGRNWSVAGRRPITVAGRTWPRSHHTWPHPFVSTRLL